MNDQHKASTVSNLNIKKQEVKREQGRFIPLSPLKKRLYSLPEAAEYLGRSVWSVRELIWKGALPSIRIGRRVHLDIMDLNVLIERNKVKTFL